MEETITVVFTYDRGHNDIVEEKMEFPATYSDKDIEVEYDTWLWELIGDRCHWYREGDE